MAENAERASRVIAPKQGTIGVESVSTSASSAVDTGVDKGPGTFITFDTNVETFLIFGDSGVVAPDETATSGNQRCFRMPADTTLSVLVTPSTRHFRHKGAASGKLRWYVSSE